MQIIEIFYRQVFFVENLSHQTTKKIPLKHSTIVNETSYTLFLFALLTLHLRGVELGKHLKSMRRGFGNSYLLM